MRNKIIFIFLLTLLISSCNIVDFGNDEISCLPSSDSESYSQEYVEVAFNCEVDHYSAEQCIKIQNNNQPLELVFKWGSNTLYAKPEIGWVNGRCYILVVNGSVLKYNGSLFSVDYKCSFVYGNNNDSFTLISKPVDDTALLVSDSISFSFNHEVSYVNFNKAFKISPSEKISYSISSDQKTITITPVSGWKINTIYKWEITNLISIDNWGLSGITNGFFKIQNDIENPDLLKICPVSDTSDPAIWFENTDIDRNISKRECIGFIFSKSMDFSTVKSGISISPNINGYLYQATSDRKRFLFVPLSNYEIETKYLITISSSVKDSIGNSLYQEIKKEFYSGDSYLEIVSLNIGGIDYSSIPDELEASTTTVNANEILAAVITFSNPIDINSRYAVVNNISLNLQFPMTSASPILLSSKWDSSNTVLTLNWGNITKSTSENKSYYDLKFNGGKSGISTGNGRYMEDSICIHIKISS